MNCYQAKTGEIAKQWYVIDATDAVVGRLAAQIAPILMGKHRPTYTAHIDTGDYVIVTNVDKVAFTGNKWRQKTYQRYSGYPGGQREEAAWKLFQRRPERILELAIRRMMPKNKISRHMLLKLKLYTGSQHPHQAQVPIPLTPVVGRPVASGAIFAVTPVREEPAFVSEPIAPIIIPSASTAPEVSTPVAPIGEPVPTEPTSTPEVADTEPTTPAAETPTEPTA